MSTSDVGIPATLTDVARHAGVSLATASRALNGSARQVNAELQKRVRWSAEQLGYSPNAQAQAVARGTSRTVAVVLGALDDPYFAGLASGVLSEAKRRGLDVTLATTGGDPEEETRVLAALRGHRPSAVLVLGSAHGDPDEAAGLDRELGRLAALGAGIATLSGDGTFPTVEVRNREGAAELARALLGRGYRRFGVLAGPEQLLTPAARAKGFAEAVRAGGGEVVQVRHGALSRDEAHFLTTEMLASDLHLDALFAVTDAMAVGSMTAMREAGRAPGRDLGVAGFDDIPVLRDITPGLSTVALPMSEIGARLIARALDGTVGAPIDGRVILRDSTPPRA